MLYLGAFFTFRRLTLHSPGHLSTRLAGYPLHSGLRFRPRKENVSNEFGEQPHLKALNQPVRCIGESSTLTWQSQCVALAISAHCIEKGNIEPRKGFP